MSDASDANDVSDATDANDASDVSDATDASDVSDAADWTDESGAGPSAGSAYAGSTPPGPKTASPARRRRWPWILGGIGIVLLLILATISSFAQYTVKRSWPQTSGDIEVSGIAASVDIVRDDLGIPTIYGDSLADIMFAQGYVHAQDRFWEMDVRRHITAGRLSEMFGKSQVPTDAFLRTLGWRRIAEQEVPMLNDTSRLMLDAYSAGVNAYLADRPASDISLEYAVLGLNNPGYLIEPWTPADSVAWLKALAWDLRGNMTDEIYRVVLASATTVDQAEQVFPPYPFDRNRPIVEGGNVTGGGFEPPTTPSVSAAATAMQVPEDDVPDIVGTLEGILASTALLDPWLGPSGKGIGSNSWAVSGEHTDTGKPILANDPHLAPSMPSLWYQAGMRCRTVTPDCPVAVAGWTMAGLPGVFIGHTDRFAWGFTNTGPDVTDLVLTKVQGDAYEYDGELVPLTVRTERIEVAGGEPVDITVRSTDSGPIISEVLDAGENYATIGAEAPVPAPGYDDVGDPGAGEYAVALRWTALQPGTTFDAFALLNDAQGFEDFRKAASILEVPAQNLLYADVDGNIGYQMPGVIPVRDGYDGKWPVPGWTSEVGWTGEIPFDELPWAYNPPEGWIVTANQAVIGPDYPYFITDDWSYGARSQRIVDLLSGQIAAGDVVGVADMQRIQMDSWNSNADFLVPRIADMPVQDATRGGMELLPGWDLQQGIDSAPAAYFNAFWRQLITRMFDSKTGTEITSASGDDQFFEVIRTLWDSPDDAWWDDPLTAGVETRDQVVTASLDAAYQDMVTLQGEDPASWSWGGLHTLLLQHGTLGASGIAPIESLFNRGPIDTAGGSGIVNATGWTPSEGFEVTWVPSMRQVIDLANFDNSTWVNLTGNSGHAFNPNYEDQVTAWQTGKQFPWAWSAQAIDQAAEATLTLVPE